MRGTGSDFQVRGYMISSAAQCVRETLGDREGNQILANLTPQTREFITSAQTASWYPVSALSEILRAFAAVSKNDEKRAQDQLVKCGSYMAKEATNTFLRLLMRMLTPGLFAKKLPDLWSRDCSRGKLEVDVTDARLVFRMSEVAGFDHAACTGAGFAVFALTTMGKVVQNIEIRNWSLANAAADSEVLITWKT